MLLWLLIKSDKVTDIVSDKVESKSERIDYAFVIVNDIPEFDISPAILELIRRLDYLHESCRGVANRRMESRLRRTSRLRSINSSLAIEGNELDILRMRDVINGRTVEGPFDEILETRNAIRAYEEVRDADLWSADDLLRIHGTLMFGCVEQEGFRTHGVCIAEGDGRVVYVAPGHDQVEPMMRRLFDWCRDSDYPAQSPRPSPTTTSNPCIRSLTATAGSGASGTRRSSTAGTLCSTWSRLRRRYAGARMSTTRSWRGASITKGRTAQGSSSSASR